MPPPRTFLYLRNQNRTERRGPYRSLEAVKRMHTRIQKRKATGDYHPNHSLTS